ncbi:chaplin [Streptomyces sp. NPDC126514]|uniref:chaplin n=1 Tax=Streptomyces sp. NPDC126514 TaxID=3155210 RepID=UPI0033195C44
MRHRILAAAALAITLTLAGAGTALADPDPSGTAANSPGVISGNVIQVPLDLDVNVCGNTVNIVGLLNPAFANACVNKD